jgi:hypothetical protein
MDNIIQHNIERTELLLKRSLEDFFLSVYPPEHLESHGLEHHRRVWKHAKELIGMKAEQEINNISFLKNLITACYLHDIGMAEDHGFNHGLSGKTRCAEFLILNNLDPEEFDLAMEAIEFHDNKNYEKQHLKNNVLHLLSLADDLDAYGFIGIYRYTDIYLRRDIDAASIGPLIRKNVAGRFENFSKEPDLPQEYREVQNERFRIIDHFFTAYENELSGYSFGSSEPSGYCGIVDIIKRTIQTEEKSNFSNILRKYSNFNIINWYLTGYQSETEF